MASSTRRSLSSSRTQNQNAPERPKADDLFESHPAGLNDRFPFAQSALSPSTADEHLHVKGSAGDVGACFLHDHLQYCCAGAAVADGFAELL